MSYPNWGRAKLVKVRNERKCRYCSNNIAPGEQAVKEAYFFGDEVVTHYSHVKCYIDDEAYNDEFIKKIDPVIKEMIQIKASEKMKNELIQWPRAKYWDKCWNFVTGCYPESEGCENCWAKRTVERFGINGGKFEPVFKQTSWPPRSGVVFIGNMSDVFGDWVDSLDLYVHFTSLSKKAINLILTKRAVRLNYFTNRWQYLPETGHMWFGVTCENQARADERIPHLLNAGVLHRWLSLEPLLGNIDLAECLPAWDDNGYPVNQLTAKNVNWVVVGHESGSNRRPGNLDDVRSVVAQCQAAGVPVFVKQLDLGGKDVEKNINKFPEDLRIRQVPWQHNLGEK